MIVCDVVSFPLALEHAVVRVSDVLCCHFTETPAPLQSLLEREIDMGRVPNFDTFDMHRRYPARLSAIICQRRHDAPVDVIRRMPPNVITGIKALHLPIKPDGQRLTAGRVDHPREGPCQSCCAGVRQRLQKTSACLFK